MLRAFKHTLPELWLKSLSSSRKTSPPRVTLSDLREKMLGACHNDPFSGHLGRARTLGKIKPKYYWPRLIFYVHLYIRTCRDCYAENAADKTRWTSVTQPHHRDPSKKSEYGTSGPFPTPRVEFTWIFVALHYLTCYTQAAALPIGAAQEGAKFLVHQVVLRYVAPEAVIRTADGLHC